MTMLVSLLVDKQFFQRVPFSLHNHEKQVTTIYSRNQLIISWGKNYCNILNYA